MVSLCTHIVRTNILQVSSGKTLRTQCNANSWGDQEDPPNSKMGVDPGDLKSFFSGSPDRKP